MPSPVLAETGTQITSPPHSSGTSSYSVSSCFTSSGLASGLSILLMATMMDTSAALAWLIGFNGLRHDAVVRSHNQNGDIGDLGAAGTHGGECLMSGGIQEGDGLAVDAT